MAITIGSYPLDGSSILPTGTRLAVNFVRTWIATMLYKLLTPRCVYTLMESGRIVTPMIWIRFPVDTHLDIAKFGIAPGLGPEARRFESYYPDHTTIRATDYCMSRSDLQT